MLCGRSPAPRCSHPPVPIHPMASGGREEAGKKKSWEKQGFKGQRKGFLHAVTQFWALYVTRAAPKGWLEESVRSPPVRRLSPSKHPIHLEKVTLANLISVFYY